MSNAPPKPDTPAIHFDAIPEKLRERDQWLLWRYQRRDGKWTKVPLNPDTGGFANAADEDVWVSFQKIRERHSLEEVQSDGIGFGFANTGMIVGVDLDDCRDPRTGDSEEWAKEIIEQLDSWSEVSPSGSGYHIYVVGTLPDDGNRRGDIEMYDEGRFFTVTGHHVDGTPKEINQRNDELAEIHAEYITDEATHEGETNGEYTPKESAYLSDDKIIELAHDARNCDKFNQLFNEGNHDDYPSQSEADLALCSILAFWTGNDPTQIDRLFRKSALMREKWERDDYRKRTIRKAISEDNDTYSPIEPSGDTWPESDRTWNLHLERRLKWARENDESISTRTHVDRTASELLDDYDFITAKGRGDDPDNDPLYVYNPEKGHFERCGRSFVLEELSKHTPPGVLSARAQGNVVKKIKRQTSVDRDTLRGGRFDKPLINIQNGVYDVEQRELLNHDPKYRFISRITADYDPEVEDESWDEFLDNVIGNKVTIETVYEWIGVCLTSDIHAQKFLLLHGEGGNGKGVFCDAIKTIYNDDQVSSVPFSQITSGGRAFGLSELEGSLINIDDDFTSGEIAHEDLNRLLSVTGDDTIQVERKYEQPFKLNVKTQMMFATNELPRFDVNNSAVPRRLMEIEFPFRFTKSDDEHMDYVPKSELMGKLDTDSGRSALLMRAIDGLHRYRERGHKFTLEVERGTDQERFAQYQLESDPVCGFATECLTNREGFVLPKDAIYNAYKRYCDANRLSQTHESAFFRALKQNTSLSISGYRPRISEGDGDYRASCYKGIWFTGGGIELLGSGDKANIQNLISKLSGRSCTAWGIEETVSDELSWNKNGSQITEQVIDHLKRNGEEDSVVSVNFTINENSHSVSEAINKLREEGKVIRDGDTVRLNR